METTPRFWDLPHPDRVGVVRDEIARVVARLRALDAEQLDSPAIGDWTVGEVVAHLAVVAEFYTDSIRRGASGDATVSGNRPAPGTGRGAIAASGIRQRAAEVMALTETPVIDRMDRYATGLADALDVDESSLDYGCYHPGGIVPAPRFAVLFLKELGLHEWDMFEALDPPCAMSRWGVDAALQAMEEELASGSLRWVTDPDASTDTLSFRLSTTGDLAVERDLVLEPEQTRLLPVDDRRAIDSPLRLDAADFVLGCSGRRDLVAVVADGRGQGDPAALRSFAARLSGM